MNLGHKHWVILPSQPDAESKLQEALQISPLLARILVQRGHDVPDKADRFLHPRLKNLSDPFALSPLREAATRIWQAVERGERIVIYGDYDVDGVTSTALLVRMLKAFGANVSSFLPNRMDEGYGLSADGIERCMAETQPKLLIAVDCGTTAVKEIADLTSRDVEVIVLDHHQPAAELPRCLLVNPKTTTQSSVANLATVGLVFKLCHGFLKLGRELGKPGVAEFDLRPHLDLVALGTVADVVPLDGENRILVKAGLEQLVRTTSIGLRALKEVAGVPSKLTPYHIGFQLGPRLNAMGRLGDALASLELLLTEDAGRARELAVLLDEHNRDRQEIEQQTVEEALEMLDAFDPSQRVIVLAKKGWHVGVIGIVAARIMREFHRPTVIIGIDEQGIGKGSCRSIEGFHIIEGLNRCSKLLERYGGHHAAAGLSIRADRVEAFREQLAAVAREMLPDDALQPSVKASAEVSLVDLTPSLMDELESLQPIGQSNPTPIFVARQLRLRAEPRIVGRGHLKLWLTDGANSFDAIGFNFGEWQPRGQSVDVAFTPQWNEYQGNRSIQMKLVDVRDH